MNTDDAMLEEAVWQVIWVASPRRPRPGINRDALGNLVGFCGSPTQAHRADLATALASGETGELQALTDEFVEAESWALLILGRLLSSPALTAPNPRTERQEWQCGKRHTPDVAFVGSRNAPSTTQYIHDIRNRSEGSRDND
jgi:hypothetical protein